jgi:hypothetical protein
MIYVKGEGSLGKCQGIAKGEGADFRKLEIFGIDGAMIIRFTAFKQMNRIDANFLQAYKPGRRVFRRNKLPRGQARRCGSSGSGSDKPIAWTLIWTILCAAIRSAAHSITNFFRILTKSHRGRLTIEQRGEVV